MGEAKRNLEPSVVEGFGQEWAHFDQRILAPVERQNLFEAYFDIFPWNALSSEHAVGADIGCGSGRWAVLVAPRVKELHLVDASHKALEIARHTLSKNSKIKFHHASVDDLPFDQSSLDFAYSLGVLHHIPDTEAGIRSIAKVLKPGAPFLIYLYYALENRPRWYRLLWKISDYLRSGISRLPFIIRVGVSETLAATVYYPIARLGLLLDRLKLMPRSWPLAYYRDLSYYVMRTDSLDRFGTKLERRFSRQQIESMLIRSGFESIQFSDRTPYWCAIAYKGPKRSEEGREI